MTIILYDIPSTTPTNAKDAYFDRTALLFKGVPFKTEWIEYPDIEGKMKEIGAAPTDKWKDGRPQYTLPVIKDESTGKVVSDSLTIAKYLDATYPSHPTLLPLGASTPAAIFEDYFFSTAIGPLALLLLADSHGRLNPPSAAYFRRTREESYGKTIEEFAPPGPVREAAWAGLKKGLSKVGASYAKGTYFFYGETLSYVDLVAVSYLLWAKIVVGPENPEWKQVEEWDGGRWAKLIALTEKYQAVA